MASKSLMLCRYRSCASSISFKEGVDEIGKDLNRLLSAAFRRPEERPLGDDEEPRLQLLDRR